MPLVIQTDNLTRRFGSLLAVDEVFLTVAEGEIFGILGHNGAGKTTTVRLLNGVLSPSAGEVRVLGLDPATRGPELRRCTGVLTETPSLDERLTARENLEIYADLYGVPRSDVDGRIDGLLEFFGLSDRVEERVGTYSKGMKQRLALARTLLHEPDLLFFDEPTAGLDPVAARQVHELITEISHEERRTVVMCTHNLGEALGWCKKAPGPEGWPLVPERVPNKREVPCRVAPGSPRCWAVSSTDSAPMFIALDAQVKLMRKGDERMIPVKELYRDDGMFYLNKAPDELVTEIHLLPTDGVKSTYWKLRRRGAFDFPALGVAVALKQQDDGTVERCRIVLGGVGSSPQEMTEAQRLLEGEKPTPDLLEQVAEAVYKPTRPLDNTESSLLPQAHGRCIRQARAPRAFGAGISEMRELQAILAHIVELTQRGGQAALATVIATSGSTYRRPGARMLVAPEAVVGAVSAGCLEEEVRTVGLQVIERGRPERLRFDTTEEMDKLAGTGLGCRGAIEVFVEPLTPKTAQPYLALQKALEKDRVCTLGIEIPTGRRLLFVGQEPTVDELREPSLVGQIAPMMRQRLSTRRPTALERFGGREIYWERLEPPLKLVVFGAGYDAQPLVKLAKELGFRVTVVDPRPVYLTRERFPEADRLVLAHPKDVPAQIGVDGRTFLVILTHNYFHDLELLRWALGTEAPYVGQIGPRDRTEELLADIERKQGALPEAARAKLYGSVGLNVGAETPEEIALSILSEILTVRSGRSGGFLRRRPEPIHGSHEKPH